MSSEIARSLNLPKKSFLLLGPRGTGKSTLLKMKVKAKLDISLLRSKQYLPLLQNPSLLQDWTNGLKAGDWIIVDEVQRIPALLNEIHSIYEDRKLHFAITGSSARKLKRGGANLLAGRALQVFLFPLTWAEMKNQISGGEEAAMGDSGGAKDTEFALIEYLDWGGLPGVVSDEEHRKETLSTYVETYLRQELTEEGLIRKLDPFARFLRIAGLYNAQVLNVESIAREAHLRRTTVDSYFEILEDTLIGSRLEPLHLGFQSKEVRHPKFYFFDSGVARACAGLIFEEVDSVWKGFALETQILHELRSYNSYRQRGKNFYYYKVANGIEVDFLVEIEKKTLSRPQSLLAIEVKLARQWDRRWSKSLNEFLERSERKVKRAIGVYTGATRLHHEKVEIFPVQDFMMKLSEGEFF
ncbi:MAG: ATPase [Bdellovibrio sp.]|nr:MAG: ATPase [Bdellovibrio sp.]